MTAGDVTITATVQDTSGTTATYDITVEADGSGGDGLGDNGSDGEHLDSTLTVPDFSDASPDDWFYNDTKKRKGTTNNDLTVIFNMKWYTSCGIQP